MGNETVPREKILSFGDLEGENPQILKVRR